MMKVKNRYPELNLDWLLLGKGKMVGGKEMKERSVVVSADKEKEREPKEVQFRIQKDKVDEITENQEVGIKITEDQTKREGDADAPKKIILLYPDDTYETYKPRQ